MSSYLTNDINAYINKFENNQDLFTEVITNIFKRSIQKLLKKKLK